MIRADRGLRSIVRQSGAVAQIFGEILCSKGSRIPPDYGTDTLQFGGDRIGIGMNRCRDLCGRFSGSRLWLRSRNCCDSRRGHIRGPIEGRRDRSTVCHGFGAGLDEDLPDDRLSPRRHHRGFCARRRHVRRNCRSSRGDTMQNGRYPSGSWGLRQRHAGAQSHAFSIQSRLDPAGDFALCDSRQHFGIRHRGFGTKIPVIGGKIAKILRNRLHRAERIIEPFKGTRESSIGNGENLA